MRIHRPLSPGPVIFFVSYPNPDVMVLEPHEPPVTVPYVNFQLNKAGETAFELHDVRTVALIQRRLLSLTYM